MKNTNIVGNIFIYIRDVIDSANDPLVLLILVILPLLVPIVPASVSATNLHDIMGFSWTLAFLSGLTIELLGFSAAILTLRSITNLSHLDKDESKSGRVIEFLVSSGSWLSYLIAVITLNVIMDIQVGKPTWYVWVIAVLCLLSVPSSALAASRVSTKEFEAKEEKRHQESREDNMERYRIRHGTSKSTSETKTELSEQFQNNHGKTGRHPVHQERVFEYMEQYYGLNSRVATYTEVMRDLNLPQSTASRLRQEWINAKNREQYTQ